MRRRLFNNLGYVKTAVKQGKLQKPKDVSEKNRKKEICLTCTRSNCTGNCELIKERMKEHETCEHSTDEECCKYV